MKKILNLFVVFSLLFFYSCDQNGDFDTDNQFGDASSGGAIIAVENSSTGKLLGAPSSLDLENATVNFSDYLLSLKMILMSGGQNVAGYEITKSLNGQAEVTVATSNTLPIELNYTSVAEFIDGLGVSETDLRIGDEITFRTKVIMNDGSVYFSGPSDGTYKVTINCSSNLAGNYGWGNYQPSLDLEEVAPGKYRMPYLARFSGIYWFEFVDVCGELTITDWQYQASNPITQNEPGFVDTDGSIVFPSLDVAGVSWYVGQEARYTKN